MRHGMIDLTMNVYTDPKLLDVQRALDSLPSLAWKSPPPRPNGLACKQPERMAATIRRT